MSDRNFYRHSHSPSSHRRMEYRGGAYPAADERRGQRSSQSRGSTQTREYAANQRQGVVRYLYHADIKTLAQSSPAEVLACVNENETGFLAAYSHDRYCEDPSMMKHLVKLLYLLVKAEDFDRIASRILARILSVDGSYALFIMNLNFLMKGMVEETKGHIRRENPQYLNYLIEIGSKAITVIPETVLNTYPWLVIQNTILELIRNGENLGYLEQKAKSLEQSFNLAREERSRHVAASVANMESTENSMGEPPEHFKDVEILPSLKEVHSGDNDIYLRPNIVKGAYSNWDHYLDVQYRLLREDFVRPLRHGIQHYCAPGLDRHSQDVRIYEKVHILKPVCLFVGMGFEIQFDVSKLTRVNWEYSRRLIFGSLLCLSKDNFEHSILFATVVKRDPILLKDGHLVIKFECDFDRFLVDPSDVFIMIESMAYFEAYRHILSKLKEISSICDEVPFKPYIIECKFGNIPAPSYASQNRRIQVDLSSILGVRSKVFLHDESSWPHAKVTNLDPSQLKALKMALTKEVSVIQGPPGTGKTFIGLKIVEALLHNRHVWDRNRESPILVVCYTNHALDQFLEGIQKMSISERSPNIIRIGGRCKNEKLSSCILQNKVKEHRTIKDIPRSLLRNSGESRNLMFRTKVLIDRQSQGTTTNGFVHLSELEGVVHRPHYLQLVEGDHSGLGRELEVWLGLWNPDIFSEPAKCPTEAEMVTKMEMAPFEEVEENPNNYIEVDNEAKLVEGDRILEGEEIELVLTDSRASGKRKYTDGYESNEPKKIKLTGEKRSTSDGCESVKIAKRKSAARVGWKTIQIDDTKRSEMISKGLKCDPMSVEEVSLLQNIWSLPLEKKWQLHNYWMKEYSRVNRDQEIRDTERYEQACEKHSDYSKKIDEYVLRGSDVVGITTTGAAKHHHVLKKIHPKVVIFEEAAEIFEAHIVTSLAPSVQQLVLIGDHKQLQPKPNCYDLEVDYKLSVSLFERLVRNRIPSYVSLNVQHRMRPEISRLIHPSIYSDLNDHASVKHYSRILGVAKDVFFIDHNEPEQSNKDSDITTHVNIFEAEYLVSLCRYLLKQDYQPDMITILTMYKGQLLELKRKMQRRDFEGVRVAAVDDFQGEENDIILLSLVRSNPEKNIGFLSKSNRICVSLSRAKKGLYVIGNLSMLRGKDKTVWPEIICDLEQRHCVGKALPLYCRVHGQNRVLAEFPEDFNKCPEGGCDQLCKTRLSCGHCCPRICHPNDICHTRYECSKECPKTLACGHKCRSKCYQCSSGCKPCSERVSKVLPSCGHEVKMLCSLAPMNYPCPRLCSKLLNCGHPCQNTCSEPCNLKCRVEVKKTLQCGHIVKELCHHYKGKIVCPDMCTVVLECGHPCAGSCGDCKLGRLHVRCVQDCGRQLVCGHTCSFPCASTCPPCTMLCNNFCVHSHCPKRCYEICDPCMEPCPWKCKHFRCSEPCGNMCDRPRCDMPCTKLLKCGHECIGLCGEKCPRLCRICDEDKVCEIFFGAEDEDHACFIVLEDCDHIFEVTGLDTWVESNDSDEIKFIICPKCKTPIRKSMRYCNQVKQTLRDVEEIKRKQLLSKSDLLEKLEKLETAAGSIIKDEVQSIREQLEKKNLHPYVINAISVQITVLTAVLKVNATACSINRNLASKLKSRLAVCNLDSLFECLEIVKTFVMQEFLSQQQISDVVCEVRRVSCLVKVCDFLCKLHEKKSIVLPEDESRIAQIVYQVSNSGYKLEKLTEEGEKLLLDSIKDLSKVYGVHVLSAQEIMMIVKAVDLSKGHWYKCINGHFYCIGECGGAVQKAKCPECGQDIGGQSHTLASGNAHAPEMDGSRFPVWSEASNLANFDLNIF